MNHTEVHKFGGGCLASPKTINQCLVRLQQSTKNNCVIAVSATLGVTDIIRKGIENLFIDSQAIAEAITAINEKHEQFIQIFPELGELNSELLKRFKDLLSETQEIHLLTEKNRDIILIIGELFMAQTFSKFLKEKCMLSTVLFPEEIDFFSDGVYFNSMIDFEKDFSYLKQSFSSSFEKFQYIVVPGFYGIDAKKNPTTFGPSGTDYTATALANILEAKKVVIWKEVDGFMSADPRIVESKLIPNLDYTEASELAHFGAKVLHPRSVLPARIKKIPIEIRNIYNENKTTISDENAYDCSIIRSISYMKKLALLKVYVSFGGRQSGVLKTLAEYFAEHNINVYTIATSSSAITFLVKENELNSYYLSLKQQNKQIDYIELIKDITLICIVGKGLSSVPGIAKKTFQCLADQNINIELISAGASSAALQFAVKDQNFVNSLQTLHEFFFPMNIPLVSKIP